MDSRSIENIRRSFQLIHSGTIVQQIMHHYLIGKNFLTGENGYPLSRIDAERHLLTSEIIINTHSEITKPISPQRLLKENFSMFSFAAEELLERLKQIELTNGPCSNFENQLSKSDNNIVSSFSIFKESTNHPKTARFALEKYSANINGDESIEIQGSNDVTVISVLRNS